MTLQEAAEKAKGREKSWNRERPGNGKRTSKDCEKGSVMILEAQEVQLLARGEPGIELSMTSTMLSETMMRSEWSREYLCTEYWFTMDCICYDTPLIVGICDNDRNFFVGACQTFELNMISSWHKPCIPSEKWHLGVKVDHGNEGRFEEMMASYLWNCFH